MALAKAFAKVVKKKIKQKKIALGRMNKTQRRYLLHLRLTAGYAGKEMKAGALTALHGLAPNWRYLKYKWYKTQRAMRRYDWSKLNK